MTDTGPGSARTFRYGTRPAFAHERMAWTADGQIAYRLKRPWPDGRTELVLDRWLGPRLAVAYPPG